MLTQRHVEDLQSKFAEKIPTDREAAQLVERLKPFGSLWLKTEVLVAARRHSAKLYGLGLAGSPSRALPPRRSRGGVWILLASCYPGHPLLRDAFVLPLRWKRGGEHSSLLPQGLAAAADGVLGDIDITGLTLHLADDLEQAGQTLATLSFGYDSAWAALAAAAIVFERGGENAGDVLVTAAWEPSDGDDLHNGTGHLARVSGVSAKLTAAETHGARLVFLAAGNKEDALAWARQPRCRDTQAEPPGVRFLGSAAGRARESLSPVLEALEVPPSRCHGDDFERRCVFHASLPKEKAERYYIDELLDEVSERLGEGIPSTLRRGGGRIIVVASPSVGGAHLLTRVFDPSAVLVLHDGDPTVCDAVARLSSDLPHVAGIHFQRRHVQTAACPAGDGFATSVRQAVDAFASEGGSSQLFVDVTLGHRDFLFALLDAVPDDAAVGYLSSTKNASGGFSAGTEELKVLGRGRPRWLKSGLPAVSEDQRGFEKRGGAANL